MIKTSQIRRTAMLVQLCFAQLNGIAAAIAQSTGNTGFGPVYNIGDVTLSVDKLSDAATLEDIVTVFRRAKQFT